MIAEDISNAVDKKPKTPSQLKKEAAKAEKLAKFRKKEQKLAELKASSASKQNEDAQKTKEVIEYISKRKRGEKKDTSVELPKAYSPKFVEAAWYDWWEKEGFFRPEYNSHVRKINSDGIFTIVIPPPNVTGTLHLGHALAITLEDVLCRWHRMKGEKVLYNPGCDHAGIATQVVVEKTLKRERGLTRHDIGRQKFIEEVWNWKNEKGTVIYDQIRKMGAGVDWDRACFMMDPKIMRAVTSAFIKMHENGIIYRSNRLVNWSCTLRSAISDIEVDKIELSGRTLLAVPGYAKKIEFGVLISFAYPIEKSNERIIVATTRIETMLGDTAVAVHPQDERYKHLIGKFCKHPFVSRRLPIIGDDFVDMEFGTGAVKITPAHDYNDYEVGKRHNLTFVTCITDDGNMSDECGDFKGLKRFDARDRIVEALKEKGLYVEIKDNPMIVPICSRSKDIIEPILKAQWYVKCDVMARRAMEAVKNGDLKIIPEFHITTWNRWLEGIRDWCISRQLWWGHRIPSYFVTVDDEKIPPGNADDNNYWISAHTETEAIEKAAKRFGVPREKISLKWDEDVLDTWFSSGIWPFSIFGWPDQTSDLKQFFPSSVLETGHDILFFWVARMVFLSQELTGQLPFKEVFLHAVIRDAHGRKMSKSLGNVVDPIDVIHGISLDDLNKKLEFGNLDERELEKAREGQSRDYPHGIPECGTDAVRFALISYTSQSRDINLDVLRVQGYRFFCNKIWQAVRFTLMQLDIDFKPLDPFQLLKCSSLLDKWILSRLSATIEACQSGLSSYNFHVAANALYRFWLYDFCDIFIEGSKPVLLQSESGSSLAVQFVLYECVDTALRLLAPFMPFITEELWQRFVRKPSNMNVPSICVAEYPQVSQYPYRNEELELRILKAMEIVKTVRSLRSDYGLTPKIKTDLYIFYELDSVDISDLSSFIGTLASSNKVIILEAEGVSQIPNGCAQVTVSAKCKIALALEGIIDMGKELNKLYIKRNKLLEQLRKLEEQTTMVDYLDRVPLNIRVNNAEKVDAYKSEIAHLNEAINALENSK